MDVQDYIVELKENLKHEPENTVLNAQQNDEL